MCQLVPTRVAHSPVGWLGINFRTKNTGLTWLAFGATEESPANPTPSLPNALLPGERHAERQGRQGARRLEQHEGQHVQPSETKHPRD